MRIPRIAWLLLCFFLLTLRAATSQAAQDPSGTTTDWRYITNNGSTAEDQQGATCAASANNEASLALAINCVNTAGLGSHTITLLGNILLTQPTALLTNPLATQVVIEGNGHTIDANGHGRVLTIELIQNLILRNITLMGGNATLDAQSTDGGGLSLVCGNDLDCNWSLLNTIVRDNQASEGGGINYRCDYHGGGSLVMQDSVIRNNDASIQGGGLIYSSDEESGACSVTLRNTLIEDNYAPDGGGMRIYRPRVTIIDSIIRNNVATQNGGGIAAQISDGFIDMTVLKSTISGNRADLNGGGLYLSSPNQGGSITLVNSTVSNNSVTNGAGGGFYTVYDNGTGLSITLLNTTVTKNRGSQGVGVQIFDRGNTPSYSSSALDLTNSIIADNESGDCAKEATGGLIFTGQPVISYGHNLDGDGTCLLATVRQPNDIPNGNANLGPLTDNGGPTLTHLLLAGSAALDAGDDISCAAEPVSGVDQRGVLRPQNGHCDIGAVEVIPNTPTPTSTPTATPTSTATSTATPTSTPSATSTSVPSGVGDTYEMDNTCTQAALIATDASLQTRTFHQPADADWVRFAVNTGIVYRIEVNVPAASRADVDLEVYPNCESVPVEKWVASFTPGVRLDFTAPADGSIYLRLANYDATVAGNDTNYYLSVYPLAATSSNRALIIVAGRLRGTDRLQSNIHTVTEAVYRLFQRNGYADDHIQYLATDSRLAGYDAAASKASLKAAITQWAAETLQANGVLTLYLIDHGSPDVFYIDDVGGQRLSPVELDEWLTQLESALPGIKINVIIEACQSGSFINNPQSISKPGRVVITSTNDQSDAKASRNGAYFSDHLITWLHQGYNLSASFLEASTVAKKVFSLQNAWLDANGNAIANEFEDAALSSQRSFAYEGTLSGDDWPPYIFSAKAPTTITNYSGVVQADVRDNVKVRSVWAVVYPPNYTPPPTGQELQVETLPTFLLSSIANGDFYAGEYPGFTQPGVYRILIQAEDNDGLVARPVEIVVTVADSKLFLPLINM